MQSMKYFPPAKSGNKTKSTTSHPGSSRNFMGFCVAQPVCTQSVDVKRGRFRMTSEELSAISKKGAELLLNATPEDMNKYRKWQ